MTTSSRRSLLALALAAALPPGVLREARAARGDVDRFALGVASGWPRPDGVSLWTRLTGADLPDAVDVRWEVARDEAFRDVAARGIAVARAQWAHSVHVDATGLAPGRWYWYRYTALGARSLAGRTRTAPASDAAGVTLDLAVASCQRWDHGHWAAWREVADDAALDLVLFTGDYIYEYPTPPGAQRPRRHDGGWALTLQQYRDRYAQYKSDPLLQRAHARAPWITIWDDHEVDNDYAGLQGAQLQPDFARQRAAAYQAWWEHMPLPAPASPSAAGLRITGRCDWGRLARIHALDTRQHRDAQACPPHGRGGATTVLAKDCPALLDARRTLLGAEQERWLADGWASDGRWNLLAQQMLFAPFTWRDSTHADTPGGMVWTDGWSGYPAARQRLLDDMSARRASNVVVLGGDAHANYVADLHARADDAASRVAATEFCGTSISSHGIAPERVAAALPFNPHIRHARTDERGWLRLHLDERALQARLRAVDDPLDAASALHDQARFAVEAGRAGAQRD
jgi:alkaline phosphatase D